jgi:hypothetical protein
LGSFLIFWGENILFFRSHPQDLGKYKFDDLTIIAEDQHAI